MQDANPLRNLEDIGLPVTGTGELPVDMFTSSPIAVVGSVMGEPSIEKVSQLRTKVNLDGGELTSEQQRKKNSLTRNVRHLILHAVSVVHRYQTRG